jgi:hypothetical protein
MDFVFLHGRFFGYKNGFDIEGNMENNSFKEEKKH